MDGIGSFSDREVLIWWLIQEKKKLWVDPKELLRASLNAFIKASKSLENIRLSQLLKSVTHLTANQGYFPGRPFLH